MPPCPVGPSFRLRGPTRGAGSGGQIPAGGGIQAMFRQSAARWSLPAPPDPPVPAARALTGSGPGTTSAMVEKEIAEIPLFARISDEGAARVAAGGVTDVPAGQVLARAGDPGIGMFVVLDGSVLVERGDLHIEIERGGFFGELALLVPDSPRIARVRAKTDARILAVPR